MATPTTVEAVRAATERGIDAMNRRTLVLNLGLLELHRWWKNGDHPDDGVGKKVLAQSPAYEGETYARREGRIVRYYRHPGIPGGRLCTRCNREMNDHGWIDSGGAGRVVCPGDWIATPAPGQNFAFPNALVEAVARFPLDLALQAAHEAAEGIGARADVPDDSTVMGLATAASLALHQALVFVDDKAEG